MPMDAWRDGDEFIVEFDLPGVGPSIDLDVERNVLTVRAERPCPKATGVDRRRASAGSVQPAVILGDTLDTDRIEAELRRGVLTLRVPVAEKAKPRKITISGDSDQRVITG